MGTWRFFPPFRDWNVHFGWLEGDWILWHPSSLSTHQLHWGWLLGTLIGLDGESSWWKKSQQVRARKTSQVLSPLLPRVSSVTNAQPCRKPMQDTAASCHLKPISHQWLTLPILVPLDSREKAITFTPCPSTGDQCKLFLLSESWHRFYLTALYLGTEITSIADIHKMILENNKASRIRLQK